MSFKLVMFIVLWQSMAFASNSTGYNGSSDATEIFKKIISQQCVKKYSMACFKMDVVRMVNRIGQTPSYQLLPGIQLSHFNQSIEDDFPLEVMASLAEGNITSLDGFFDNKVNNYINSLTLNVKILDSGTILNARKWGEKMLVGYTGDQTGRKKGGGGGGAAAMMAAGSMAALGMAGLAALSGKALMTAMLAMALAAAGAFKGHGGGEKCTHYIDATHHKSRRMIEADDRMPDDPVLDDIYINERKPSYYN